MFQPEEACNHAQEYCLEYTHNGTRWAMNFFAEDAEDAAQKVQSVRNSLVLLGKLEMRIPYGAQDAP